MSLRLIVDVNMSRSLGLMLMALTAGDLGVATWWAKFSRHMEDPNYPPPLAWDY